VQASSSANSDATLDFGKAADPNGVLAAVLTGVSEAVVTYERDGFNGDLYTDAANIENLFYAEGTVFEWALDHDGDAGTASANVCLLFVFEA
jgi:hypothetical protein